MSDLIKLIDLIDNSEEIDLSNKIKLFLPVDETIYVKLAILYNTLEQSDILSNKFVKHIKAFIMATDKCFF
jgi:hypothetical protein